MPGGRKVGFSLEKGRAAADASPVRCDDGLNISFFHPGLLMPRMGCALINRIPRFRALADAFAGPCSILIEVRLIGVNGVGIELLPRLVKGHLCSLQGLDCSLLQGDAKRLPLHDGSIDAVVLDTP